MEEVVVPWNWMKYVWNLMNIKKLNFYRELTPMTRVYTQMEMVLFSFSITAGRTFFYRIPHCVLKHGDVLMLFWVLYIPILLITAGCFAEMAALMPAVGAHYHYCYSTIGEIVAFLVGWHLIFAYTTITMARCKFLSQYIDHNLLEGWISRNLKYAERDGFLFFCLPGYVDIISPMLAISMAFQAAWAVKFTKSIVNVLTTISFTVMMIITVVFAFNLEFTYVNIGKSEDSEKLYDSLYTVHRALIGYECLSVLGEEAKDPTKTIPRSIMISVRILVVIYCIYTFTMSICLKEQSHDEIDMFNPLGNIVIKVGLPWLYWIATIGTVCGVWCSAYGSMFITIRLLYAMSRDGMIFKHFSKIDRYTKKPAIPAMFFGVFTGMVTTFLHVRATVGFCSLILAKIMTTICLLITRYRYENKPQGSEDKNKPDVKTTEMDQKETEMDKEIEEKKANSWVLVNYPNEKTKPTETTHRISMILIYNSVISSLCSVSCLIALYIHKLGDLVQVFKVSGFISIIFSFIFSLLLKFQPTNDRANLAFITPYIPAFPLVAIVADFISCLILCRETLVYGAIWTIFGVIFYFTYSIRYSTESRSLFSDGTRWNPFQSYTDGILSWPSKKNIHSLTQYSDENQLTAEDQLTNDNENNKDFKLCVNVFL
ncbi:cationic amino acid transporter 2 [Halyomorpha halys]|uniref:cationic amino acid transporter 2 n=1 Tax=Halyomorpha halys TaxID=286706 RepID=UPI0006D4D791|nr:cationic amino acid transporter 2-like [Halyomorpha halys]